jgi:CubicO group peptidase (beta-lactamase class C family)
MKNSILHRFACIIAASTIAGEMALAIAAPIILDLSKDLVESPSINKSPSAVNILEFIKGTQNARTLMVIDDGQVVISYARDDVDPNEPYQVHSVTKSVTSLLIGVLVDAGDLSVNDTLGQIFTNETTWEGVEDVEFRKVR